MSTPLIVPPPLHRGARGQYKFHVLLTTFEMVSKDASVFSRIRFKAVVADEAHRLKGLNSKIREVFRSIQTEWTLLLTGA